MSEDEKKKLEELAKQRIENHAKTVAEMAKNEIELIDDTYAKRKASLEEEMRLYTEAKKKSLKKKFSQEDYDNALI
jgi:biotin-(acetyl-CoA carboxylase) ligase